MSLSARPAADNELRALDSKLDRDSRRNLNQPAANVDAPPGEDEVIQS